MITDKHIAFHLRFGDRSQMNLLKSFMKTVLKKAGVSILILEIDKNFVYEKHPEVDGGPQALKKSDAEDLQRVARENGIEIVPLFQCLGHQGWGGSRSALLTAYPEFDETPDVPLEAQWPEIFCRSWCPNHPKVNDVVYDLLDEMIQAFKPKFFHIGMDEVYEIASDQCDRCRGKDRAKLFAKAVKDMHTFIKGKYNIDVMMWADRLLDAEKFGYDNWEADNFGTFRAIDQLPDDIILLDWHYDEREKGYPTPVYLMEYGYRVMPACWFKENVAAELFGQADREAGEKELTDKYFGKLVTSWNHWDDKSFEAFIDETVTEENSKELNQLYRTLISVKEL